LGVLRGNDPAELFGRVRGGAVELLDRINDSLLDFGSDVVPNGDQVVGADQALAGVGEFAISNAPSDGFPVGAVDDDDRGFTAQLQCDRGELLGGPLVYAAAETFRAGKK